MVIVVHINYYYLLPRAGFSFHKRGSMVIVVQSRGAHSSIHKRESMVIVTQINYYYTLPGFGFSFHKRGSMVIVVQSKALIVASTNGDLW